MARGEGYEPPACSTVAVDTRYVTRLYRRAPSANGDWKAAAVVSPPDEKRLVMVMPLEDDRWYVTFCGLNGEMAPTDDDGLLAYARSLPTPIVAELMASSEPLGPPVTHRFPANQRRHVERMRRFPLGWVLLGDAISSFDPVYGQGITSAAMQADALAGALTRRRGSVVASPAGTSVPPDAPSPSRGRSPSAATSPTTGPPARSRSPSTSSTVTSTAWPWRRSTTTTSCSASTR